MSIWSRVFFLITFLFVGITGCEEKKKASVSSVTQKPLRVGVTAGPHAMILAFVKQECERRGTPVEIVEFNDFILPNAALDEGDLDLNCYQHEAYLTEQIRARGYRLVSVGKTVTMPLGLYSEAYKKIEDFPQGAKIAIPNDPSNGGRALELLQKRGMITLNKTVVSPAVRDIIENPKGLVFIEIDAPLLPKTLQDVAAAAINTDWVLVSGLNPEGALAREDKDSPFTNVLVVKSGREKDPTIASFIAAYQSPETRSFIEETFKGAVVAAW